jgi:hypothetical protein
MVRHPVSGKYSLFPLLQLDRVHAVLLEAERGSEMLDDQRRLAQVLICLAHYCWATGVPGLGVAPAERVLSTDIAKADMKLHAQASFALGLSLHAIGDYRKAAERLREVIASLQGDLLRDRLGVNGYPSVFARTWLALGGEVTSRPSTRAPPPRVPPPPALQAPPPHAGSPPEPQARHGGEVTSRPSTRAPPPRVPPPPALQAPPPHVGSPTEPQARLFGRTNSAIRDIVGSSSASSWIRFPVRAADMTVRPVTFAPGRGRLATTPVATGSIAATKTSGMVLVALA